MKHPPTLPFLLLVILTAAPQLFAQQPYPQPTSADLGVRRLPEQANVAIWPTPTDLQGLSTSPTAAVFSQPAPLQSASAEAQQVSFTFADEAAPAVSPWTKGDFKVVPYGYLWAVGAYNSSRANPGSYSIYIFSDDQQGEDEMVFDARNTRLGLDVSGPDICFLGMAAKAGGKVEIDFQNVANQTNKGTVMLRHAYVEVKNDYYRFLAGQTWDIIAPLNPPTIMYSVGWVPATSAIAGPSSVWSGSCTFPNAA